MFCFVVRGFKRRVDRRLLKMNMAAQQKHLSPQDMLLLCLTVSCVLFGSSAGPIYEEKCIGSTMTLPILYTPPYFKGKMYFTPRGWGSRKLIMDNGEAKDPRLRLSYLSAELRDLTKRDEGTFSVSFFDDVIERTALNSAVDRVFTAIRLNILVCSEDVATYYGATYSGDVPSETVFLEFTRLNSRDQPAVLWNRTDPQTFNRGRVRLSGDTWEIKGLTQSDKGDYSFREKDNTLLKTIKFEVKEHVSHYNARVMEQIFIENKFGGPLWSVTFTRKGDEEDSSVSLIVRGQLVRYRYNFERRLQLYDGGIQIDDVERGDSGTFEFRDQQGNLAQIAELVVEDVMDEEDAEVINIFIAVGIVFAVIVCCCCVRKCCCKKSSSKRDESTLPVYNHDSTQPAGPSYSAAPAPHHSYQPINSSVPKQPTATSLKPSVNNQVNIHVNPPQPEVAPLGGQRTDPAPALGSDCLSSDPGPQFELKGPTFLTAPPLSSDSTFSDVYSSDKLNFL